MIEIAHLALIMAFVLALLQSFMGNYAASKNNINAANFAIAANNISFMLILISFLGLIYSHIVSDFSVKNVAENSHSLKPMIYKIAGAWGNHEGSMLLWVLVSSGFSFCLGKFGNDLNFSLRLRAIGIQGLIITLVCAYVIFASNPFTRLDPAPIQGNDLNPLLQDPALALHPPFLYLGYVGLSLVYSLAIAGLLEGRTDAAFAKWLRPWVMASWTFLTIGIALGSYWAYYELGWGGWWFWDPVENASFMPWLMATALLHSAIVTEKRGALAAWTVLLAILSFSLSLLGTFLVRSGVLTSVHAFALDPERGIWILLILAFFTGGGLFIYGLKASSMASDKGLFAPISRESALVLNNLFLVTASLTILIGTLYPLLGEAIYGRAISVGAPYFNAVFTPIMSVALVFLPIATFLSWKRSKLIIRIKTLLPAFIIAIIIGLLIAILAKNKPMSAVGFALAIWVILGAAHDIWNRVKLKGGSLWSKLTSLRIGNYAIAFAHIGVGLFIIGSVAQTSFHVEKTYVISVGQTIKFNDYDITLKSLYTGEGPNYYSDHAIIEVKNKNIGFELHPEKRYYPFAKMPTTEVARKSFLWGDFYVALGEPNFENGRTEWILRVYLNHLIWLIYFGVFLMTIGGFLSLFDRGLRFAAPTKNLK